jgi:hypothetical protein
MKILKATLILILLLMGIVVAHQPRIVYNRENSQPEPIIVADPETSKAYYGELKGKQDYYMISSEKPFNLYLNILTPYMLEDNQKDFSVEVRDFTSREVLILDGTKSEWKLFYEPFGRDNYLQGPEARKEVDAGVYYINVSSTNNQGKYSLAIGEVESFPINEIFKTFYTVPKIKREFFGKPWYMGYVNMVGVTMLATLAILIFLIWLARKLIKIRKKRKNPSKQ